MTGKFHKKEKMKTFSCRIKDDIVSIYLIINFMYLTPANNIERKSIDPKMD